MIDAECPWCHAEGPHPVTEDNETSVEAVCQDCGCAMNVVLYDNKVSNYRAKDN